MTATARRPVELADHGTRARYNHRTMPCRCTSCRRANADYVASTRRAARTVTWHQLTIGDALAGRR